MPGAAGIHVERLVPSEPGTLFEFLSDLENHWLIADRFVQVLELERAGPNHLARGGRVKIRGPMGLRRIAVTRVMEVEPQTRMAGTAQIGVRTLAHVSWTLLPEHGGTRVQLAARLEQASLLDRVLFAAGGATWIRRRFARILATLEGHLQLERRLAHAPG